MTEKLAPHSIPALLYIEKGGVSRGYKQELLKEVSKEFELILVCPECKGIIREGIYCKTARAMVCRYCTNNPIGPTIENVQQMVSQQKCRCPLSGKGCDWAGKLGDVTEHMKKCEKLLLECSLKCALVMEREFVLDHQNNECPERITICQYCNDGVKWRVQMEHLNTCKKRPIKCVAGCGQDVIREEMDMHVGRVCPNGGVECPYKVIGCAVNRLKRREIDKHLKEFQILHQQLLLKKLIGNNEQRSVKKNTGLSSVWILLSVIVLAISVFVHYQTQNDNKIEMLKREFENELTVFKNNFENKLQGMDNVQLNLEKNENKFNSMDEILLNLEKKIENKFNSMDEILLNLEKKIENKFNSMDEILLNLEKKIENKFQGMDDKLLNLEERIEKIESQFTLEKLNKIISDIVWIIICPYLGTFCYS